MKVATRFVYLFVAVSTLGSLVNARSVQEWALVCLAVTFTCLCARE